MDRIFRCRCPSSRSPAKPPQTRPAGKPRRRTLHDQLPGDARRFNVRDYGATGDGVHLDMPAIQAAVDAACAAGGGIVLLPPGVYRTGTVRLNSGVQLHLDEGATILGSTNRTHYPQQGLIYADGARNIAVTGPGVIDGQGQAFTSRAWRVQILYLNDCDGVNVCDVTTRNSGSWTQHYIRCRNLSIAARSTAPPRLQQRRHRPVRCKRPDRRLHGDLRRRRDRGQEPVVRPGEPQLPGAQQPGLHLSRRN